MPKFYETAKFKKLSQKWEQKLKDSGFDDIEQSDGNLKVWTATKIRSAFSNHTAYQAKEYYYRKAAQFLHTHIFKTPLQKQIWEKHVEGLSLTKIDEMFGLKMSIARRTVDALRKEMESTINLEENEDDK